MRLAQRVAQNAGLTTEARTLSVHLRLFKASTNTSGGYLQTELQAMQESLCPSATCPVELEVEPRGNLEPETFSFIAAQRWCFQWP